MMKKAQMLLATGVVLLLSLLSMAVFSVKVAGLTSAHEPNADSVIETTKEVVDVLPSLLRIVLRYGSIMEWKELMRQS